MRRWKFVTFLGAIALAYPPAHARNRRSECCVSARSCHLLTTILRQRPIYLRSLRSSNDSGGRRIETSTSTSALPPEPQINIRC